MTQTLNRTLFHADNLPVLRGIDTGKGGDITLTGLVRQNKRDGWMSDTTLAGAVLSVARNYGAGGAAGGNT